MSHSESDRLSQQIIAVEAAIAHLDQEQQQLEARRRAIAKKQRKKRPASEWYNPKTGTGRLRRPNAEANSKAVPKVD